MPHPTDPYAFLLPAPRDVRRLPGSVPRHALTASPAAERASNLPLQTYRLTLTPGSISITAADAAGERHARATLDQIRSLPAANDPLPAVEITDAPAVPRRGLMLDISRTRIPTMPEFGRLIPQLAGLKLDCLQLYTEHAFAYANAEPIWAGTDPITPDEARTLDQLCQSQGLELAANQNCFGHLTRWLAHPAFAHLAETHGDWMFAGMPRTGPFSLCPTDPASLPFVEQLLDQLLPCFNSPVVNIGCDETHDVGQGRSREAVARLGKPTVYGSFVADICRLALDRGKTPMFWADIAREYPDVLGLIPPEAVALAWAYEPDHDFATDAEIFATNNRSWWACPGSSSWRSFAGRPTESRANIRSAARSAATHNADGLLLTDWGDLGHRQTWPTALLPIAEAADAAWTGSHRNAGFTRAASWQLFADPTGRTVEWLEALGDADAHIRRTAGPRSHTESPRPLANASALFTELHPPPLRLNLPDDPNPWREVSDRLAQLATDIPEPADDLIARELRHALRCQRFACCVALARRGDPPNPHTDLLAERDAIAAEHAALWIHRSRPGPLPESQSFWNGIDLA